MEGVLRMKTLLISLGVLVALVGIIVAAIILDRGSVAAVTIYPTLITVGVLGRSCWDTTHGG